MNGLVSIDSKGYGKIYKAVMRDRELPILAKTIYAYFCAYAGCGRQAYPKRDKIVRDLQINKDTYTKHLGLLVERGYIARERTAEGNLYTILQSVPTYGLTNIETADTDILLFDSIAAQGFGTVPKMVMLDRNLSPQAKAIYAYFASFAGAGTTAFPRRSTIMRELQIKSPGTYYRHFNLLVEAGYLSAEQRKDNGRFDICVYRLHDVVCIERPEETRRDAPKGAEYHPMSEKSVHGGELLKTSPAMSEKPLSEKLISEKLEHQIFGQPDINNSSITNSSLEKEQEYNHQRQGATTPCRCYTSADVMKLIHYDQLKKDFAAWGSLLKNTLGRMQTPEEDRRYQQVTQQILIEIVNQLTRALNTTETPDALIKSIQSSAFSSMIDGFLDHWEQIRNVKAYVSASLKNLQAACV